MVENGFRPAEEIDEMITVGEFEALLPLLFGLIVI